MALLAVVGVIGIALLSSDGDPKPASTPSTTAGPPAAGVDLDAGAEELLALLARGEDRTYHARYEGRAPEGDQRSLTIEVWRKGGLVRHETEGVDEAGRVRSAVFQLPGSDVTCRRGAEEPWRCDRVSDGADTPASVLDRFASDLEGRQVAVRNERVKGRPARCFTAAGGGADTKVCVTLEGLLVLVASDGARLELVELSEKVDDAVFTPPA